MELPQDNNLYFACIDLTDRRCLVVGGNEMAVEKIEGLLAAGADVTVIAADSDERLLDLQVQQRITLLAREFDDTDVRDAWLVIAATGDPSVDRKVASAGESQNKLVNVADVPELCNFILPAIVRDGPIAVGISTAGASPALAQRIKREVAETLHRPFASLAARLRALRPWARDNLPTYERRRDFFRSVVDASPDPLDLIEQNRTDELDAQLGRLKDKALRDERRSSSLPEIR